MKPIPRRRRRQLTGKTWLLARLRSVPAEFVSAPLLEEVFSTLQFPGLTKRTRGEVTAFGLLITYSKLSKLYSDGRD